MKTCTNCLKAFEPLFWNQTYCCPNCRRDIHNYKARRNKAPQHHKCEQCGKEYQPRTPNNKYCSVDCRLDAFNAKNRRTNPLRKQCAGCGAEFIPKHHASQYCKPDCKPHRRASQSYAPRLCTECNTRFVPLRSNQVTCGGICAQERQFRKQREAAERHEVWQDYLSEPLA